MLQALTAAFDPELKTNFCEFPGAPAQMQRDNGVNPLRRLLSI